MDEEDSPEWEKIIVLIFVILSIIVLLVLLTFAFILPMWQGQ